MLSLYLESSADHKLISTTNKTKDNNIFIYVWCDESCESGEVIIDAKLQNN